MTSSIKNGFLTIIISILALSLKAQSTNFPTNVELIGTWKPESLNIDYQLTFETGGYLYIKTKEKVDTSKFKLHQKDKKIEIWPDLPPNSLYTSVLTDISFDKTSKTLTLSKSFINGIETGTIRLIKK